jgi:hypothetical protein
LGDGNNEEFEVELAFDVVEIREGIVTLNSGTSEQDVVAVVENAGIFIVEFYLWFQRQRTRFVVARSGVRCGPG